MAGPEDTQAGSGQVRVRATPRGQAQAHQEQGPLPRCRTPETACLGYPQCLVRGDSRPRSPRHISCPRPAGLPHTASRTQWQTLILWQADTGLTYRKVVRVHTREDPAPRIGDAETLQCAATALQAENHAAHAPTGASPPRRHDRNFRLSTRHMHPRSSPEFSRSRQIRTSCPLSHPSCMGSQASDTRCSEIIGDTVPRESGGLCFRGANNQAEQTR